jgi:hypothetical protein
MYPVFGSAKAQKGPRFGGWFASVEEALALGVAPDGP